MPRKYHRPPATKRRKGKKQSTPEVHHPAPDSSGGTTTSVAEAEAPEQEAGIEREVVEPTPRARRSGARNLVRDYSYVRSEMLQIVVLSAVLMVFIVVVAIIRG